MGCGTSHQAATGFESHPTCQTDGSGNPSTDNRNNTNVKKSTNKKTYVVVMSRGELSQPHGGQEAHHHHQQQQVETDHYEPLSNTEGTTATTTPDHLAVPSSSVATMHPCSKKEKKKKRKLSNASSSAVSFASVEAGGAVALSAFKFPVSHSHHKLNAGGDHPRTNSNFFSDFSTLGPLIASQGSSNRSSMAMGGRYSAASTTASPLVYHHHNPQGISFQSTTTTHQQCNHHHYNLHEWQFSSSTRASSICSEGKSLSQGESHQQQQQCPLSVATSAGTSVCGEVEEGHPAPM